MELETYETRHSKFLAYLLKPQETHQMGDLFLKEFLKEIFPDEKISLDGKSFSDFQVKTEVWCDDNKENRLDILLLNPKEKIFYAIEHKIKSKAGKGQLKRYKETLSKKYYNYTQKFLFLTPDGDDPKYENWTPVAYEKILDVLDRIIKFYDHKISKDFVSILKQYKATIKRDICMNDEKLNNLCDMLYKNHKEALDYIVEYLGTAKSLSGVLKKIEEVFVKESSKTFSTKLMPSKLLITFKEMAHDERLKDPVEKDIFKGTNTYLGVVFEKSASSGLCWKLLLGPTNKNNDTRQKIVAYFRNEAKKENGRKPQDSASWTTLYSNPKFLSSEQIEKFNDGVDIGLTDKVSEIINNNYPQWVKEIKAALESIAA